MPMFVQLAFYAQTAASEPTPPTSTGLDAFTGWGTMILYLIPALLAVLATVAPAKSTRLRPLLLPGVLICLLLAAVDMGPFLYLGYSLSGGAMTAQSIPLVMFTGVIAGAASGLAALTCLFAALAFARSDGWRPALPWLPLGAACLILSRGISAMFSVFLDDPASSTPETITNILSAAWQDRPTWILGCLLVFLLLRFIWTPSLPKATKFGSQLLPTLVVLAALTTTFMGPLYLWGYAQINPEIEPSRFAFSATQGVVADAAAWLATLICVVGGLYFFARRRILDGLVYWPLAISFWIVQSGLSAQVIAPGESLEANDPSLTGTLYAEIWQDRPTWILICLAVYLILSFLANKADPPNVKPSE
jgi:hypothetical protein